MSGPRSLSERRRPVISFIIQFSRHPSELATICERLQDPRVEIIVHADSHTAEDEEALARAEGSHGAVVIRSDNLHEIRGYNIAASRARGQLLVFSQDDRMPPPASEQPSWVERVLAVFRRGWLPRLGALGLHRGGVGPWFPTGGASSHRIKMVGLCGDASDDTHGHKWDALFSQRMSTPIRFVSFMNIGPIVVRKGAFDAVGGFNASYSLPGQLGVGFDHELIGRLWLAGYTAAVACPSRATHFRNGCGGKGTAADPAARRAQTRRNQRLYTAEFAPHAARIEAAVARAQRALVRDEGLLTKLRGVLRGCIDCEPQAGDADSLQALQSRSLGFAEACPTADPKRIQFEA